MKLIAHKTLILAAILAIGSASAASTTSVGGGQLQFSGSIISSSCQVTINSGGSGNSLTFNESIPNVAVTHTAGDIINNDTKNINIRLSNCGASNLDTSKITTSFSYGPTTTGQPYIADTSGGKSGLGFEIFGAGNQGVLANKPATPANISDIQGTPSAATAVTLTYGAAMIATAATVSSGATATATVPFTIQIA